MLSTSILPKKRFSFLKVLGPGLLMAGAAIGVSHLVQSTRAGAGYGVSLLVAVLLANFFKYPFFEYGHRYAVATGENLLEGYQRLGRGFLHSFLVLNGITAVISIAGVTLVTAALAQQLFPGLMTGPQALTLWSALLMVLCGGILFIGRYKGLDLLIKGMLMLLFVATAAAFSAALWHGPVAAADFEKPAAWSLMNLGFIIALMGWMPAPIELSVWQSLWFQARSQQMGRQMTFAEARFDFNFGYGVTVLLAAAFLGLGALVMYGSGETFSDAGGVFVGQVIRLYTETIGAWARPLITIAAFTAMFSTLLTLVDAYPRSLAVGLELAVPRLPLRGRALHRLKIVLGCGLGLAIIAGFRDDLKGLVDLATKLAFLAAPVFAFLNYRLIVSKWVPVALRPHRFLRWLSCTGILFLIGFSLLFLGHLIGN